MESRGLESPAKHLDAATSVLMCMDATSDSVSFDRFQDCSVLGMAVESSCLAQHDDSDTLGDIEASNEYLSVVDNHQSILVSFSSRWVEKGDVCERSRLLHIKFYGSFDKPLGRFLHDDLFDQQVIEL
ncbi:hypothetical protein Dimus_010344 [Dionaea muscipula]